MLGEEGNDDALLMPTRRMTIGSLIEASRSSSSGSLDDYDGTKQIADGHHGVRDGYAKAAKTSPPWRPSWACSTSLPLCTVINLYNIMAY